MTLVNPWTRLTLPVTMVVMFVPLSTVWLPLSLFIVSAVLWGTFRRLVSVSRSLFPPILVVAILTPLGVFRIILMFLTVAKWGRHRRVLPVERKNT